MNNFARTALNNWIPTIACSATLIQIAFSLGEGFNSLSSAPLNCGQIKGFRTTRILRMDKVKWHEVDIPAALEACLFLIFFFFWLQLAGKQTRSAVQTQAGLKKKYRGQFEKGEQNVVSTQNKLMQRLGLLISSDYGWTFKWGADSSS